MMGLIEIENRVQDACTRANRVRESVTLIAVSKVQPLERVDEVLAQGQRFFGENRVQEAEGKWPAFQEKYGKVDLHLIGPLQTNKARAAMELFDTIQTVDREKLAVTLARLAQEIGTCPELFVQVNTGEEDQKAGVLPRETDAFLKKMADLDLPVKGLMCIPPVDEDPALHFALLAKIAERIGISALSMGMSSDFETAIALGATHIRVGSAIFGERSAPQG